MAGNVIVKMLRFHVPASKRAAGSNAAHLDYIGRRPGTDRSITDESLNIQSALSPYGTSSDDTYIQYIGTRPGVDKKGVHGEHLSVNHGLFSQDGVPDINAVIHEVRSLKNSPMYRFVISLDEKTASELGFDSKEKWENLLRGQVGKVAEQMSIPVGDVGWVAALHLKDGHPHVHLSVWDKLDRTRRNRGLNFIPKDSLREIKSLITKAIYEEKRQELYAVKNAGRDMILEMAKDDTQQVREFLRRVSQHPETITMPSPTNGCIAALGKSIKELADIMPSHGRVNYAFMPQAVKEKVDAIVKQVLANPIYAAKLRDVTTAVRSLTEQFTGRLDKIESASDNAAADISKRIAQQVLRSAADVAQDTAKISIHESIPHLLAIKRPINMGAADTLKFFGCLAAAGVDRQTALTLARNLISVQQYAALKVMADENPETPDALVSRAYDAPKEKINIKDWKRVADKIETAEERAIINERRSETQALANASYGLLRSVFSLLQRPKGKNPLHKSIDQMPHRRKREALYTKDELE